jgi:putative addiction module component (TIGR02574 family)
MSDLLKKILKLSLDERIALVDAIWESIPAEMPTGEFSTSRMELLENRLAAHKENPENGDSWSEVKGRILNGI